MQTLQENISLFSLSIDKLDEYIDVNLLKESTENIRLTDDSFLNSIQQNMQTIEELIKNSFQDIKNKKYDISRNNISKCEHLINLVEIIINTPERPKCLLFQETVRRAKVCIHLLKRKLEEISISKSTTLLPELHNVTTRKAEFKKKNNITLSQSTLFFPRINSYHF